MFNQVKVLSPLDRGIPLIRPFKRSPLHQGESRLDSMHTVKFFKNHDSLRSFLLHSACLRLRRTARRRRQVKLGYVFILSWN